MADGKWKMENGIRGITLIGVIIRGARLDKIVTTNIYCVCYFSSQTNKHDQEKYFFRIGCPSR